MAGAEVEIGGARATVTDVTETTITATTPPGALGEFDVLARNPDGQTDVMRLGFEYVRPPRIQDVQPRSGTPAGGTPITITGTVFRPGVRVLIGGQLAANVTLVSDTTITATTPPSPGMTALVDIVVENADGQSDSVRDGFTYQVSSPGIFDVRPRSGPSTLAIRVTMTGMDFLPGAQLRIGGQLAAGITVVSPTEITADTPIQPTVSGLVDVEVRNPDSGADVVPQGFEYIPPPRIFDVQPGSGPKSGGTLITITGTDFQIGAQVLIDGRSATIVPLGSTVEITAITPPLPIPVLPGPVDVRVENPDGQDETVPGGFTYTP